MHHVASRMPLELWEVAIACVRPKEAGQFGRRGPRRLQQRSHVFLCSVVLGDDGDHQRRCSKDLPWPADAWCAKKERSQTVCILGVVRTLIGVRSSWYACLGGVVYWRACSLSLVIQKCLGGCPLANHRIHSCVPSRPSFKTPTPEHHTTGPRCCTAGDSSPWCSRTRHRAIVVQQHVSSHSAEGGSWQGPFAEQTVRSIK